MVPKLHKSFPLWSPIANYSSGFLFTGKKCEDKEKDKCKDMTPAKCVKKKPEECQRSCHMCVEGRRDK
jgi:hypothetical protein